MKVSLEQVTAALRDREPVKTAQLAAELGATANSVAGALRHAQRVGLAHVAEWEPNPSGKPLALWAYGEGKPARRFDNNPVGGSYTLRPRVDPMIWMTAGRPVPGMKES
jgi:hypothetical protein